MVAILASLFVLMAIQVKQGSPPGSESYVMRLASPLLRAASSVTGGISGIWGRYVDLRGTQHRNQELEERVTVLQMQIQQLEEARLQNERLRTLLELKDGMGTPSVVARVIGNNAAGLSRTMIVDRGSDSGVRTNMPAVAAQGVVGRVWTVSPKISKIQLITDVDAGTAVIVQRTRVQGILQGLGTEACSLKFISHLDDVKEEDLIITSGLDRIYPKGLPVGRVHRVGPGPGILQAISVNPRVKFDRLEEVLILTSSDIPLPEALPPEAPGDVPEPGPAPPAPSTTGGGEE